MWSVDIQKRAHLIDVVGICDAIPKTAPPLDKVGVDETHDPSRVVSVDTVNRDPKSLSSFLRSVKVDGWTALEKAMLFQTESVLAFDGHYAILSMKNRDFCFLVELRTSIQPRGGSGLGETKMADDVVPVDRDDACGSEEDVIEWTSCGGDLSCRAKPSPLGDGLFDVDFRACDDAGSGRFTISLTVAGMKNETPSLVPSVSNGLALQLVHGMPVKQEAEVHYVLTSPEDIMTLESIPAWQATEIQRSLTASKLHPKVFKVQIDLCELTRSAPVASIFRMKTILSHRARVERFILNKVVKKAVGGELSLVTRLWKKDHPMAAVIEAGLVSHGFSVSWDDDGHMVVSWGKETGTPKKWTRLNAIVSRKVAHFHRV
jgi:hypothetical protein